MTKVILVRHCQAEGNLKRFFQGKIDSDITEEGAKQIAQVAMLLCSEPIDEIYSSPKIRALKTAEGINLYHELPIHIDEQLVEIDAGDWEGVPLTEIETLYPEQMDNWKNAPDKFAPENGETMKEVYERVKKALLKIVSENKNKTICIVSHGCAIKNMMCFIHGWSIEKIKDVPLSTNTAVNVISFDENLNPTILIENYIDHIQKTVNFQY